MKQLYSIFFLLSISGLLSAQVKLDVQGDARINKRLEIVDNSTIIGNQAGQNDDGGNQNVFIGHLAGAANISGFQNTYLGANTGNSGEVNHSNTFVGNSAGSSNEANLNTFIGAFSGSANTNGFSNTFVGYTAGSSNTSGANNTMVGRASGNNNEDGYSNTFLGQQSGQFNTSGFANTFIGRLAGDNNLTGSRQTMLGYRAESIDGADDLDRAIAIGYEAKVGCNNCAVIGGLGVNAVNVGIGINQDLNARLSLYNASNGNSPHLSLMEEDAGDFSRLKFENAGLLGHWILAARGNAAGTPRFNYFYNDEAGSAANVMTLDGTNFNVGIGTTTPNPAAKLDVMGDIYINNAFHASDRRFKEDIRPIRRPMEMLTALEGVTYQFRKNQFSKRNFTSGRHYGLIAQDLEQVLPELVRDREDGYKAVNYDGLIPVLIEGVKQQQSEIESLERTVLQQQEQIEKLTSLVNRLIEKESDEAGNNLNLLLQDRAGLGQNHPNPFHQNTVVDYQIPQNAQRAYLQVTGANGKELGRIAITSKGAGQVTIKANSYPAGTYFYSLVVDGEVVETKKMVLTR